MFAASEISNIQNKKFVSFAAREIIGSVCVMLLFCSSCSTTKLYYEYESVPENVYLVLIMNLSFCFLSLSELTNLFCKGWIVNTVDFLV